MQKSFREHLEYLESKGKLLRVKKEDRVQVITFAGSTRRLFEKAVPANDENIAKALSFTQMQRGGGGTRMLQGIREVLKDPVDPERVRIVIMLTDGFIGNEAEIIREVGENCGDFIRFGIIEAVHENVRAVGERINPAQVSLGVLSEGLQRVLPIDVRFCQVVRAACSDCHGASVCGVHQHEADSFVLDKALDQVGKQRFDLFQR